jgi:multicomponent Na+:H+ antiporter subunit G
MIGEALVLAGALLMLLAGVGVLRFPGALARMHALTKASTLGVLLALGGAAVRVHDSADTTLLVLAAALQLLTSPLSANLLTRAAYLSRRLDARRDDSHPA